ncbi:MAG: peroxiredoxin family protein, partial [Acidimicrobiales bacterium]
YQLGPRLLRMAKLLPAAEVLVAAGLLFSATSRAAAVMALVMLAVFSAFLLRAGRQGRSGECNCFGALSTSATRQRPLLRNGLLAVGVAFVASSAAQPSVALLGRDLRFASSHPFASGVLSAAVLGAVSAVVFFRYRQPRLLAALTSPPEAADILGVRPGQSLSRSPSGVDMLVTLDGEHLSLAAARGSGDRLVLVFVDPTCGPCRTVIPALRQRWSSLAATAVLIVTSGPPALVREFLAGFPADRIIVDEESLLPDRFGVLGTPAAVLLSREGTVVEQMATGATEIDLLLRLTETGGSAVMTSFRSGFSRREIMTAAGVGTALAVTASACGGGTAPGSSSPVSGAGTKGGAKSGCPSCGTCVDCEITLEPGSGSPKLKCRPCKKKCSTADLCRNYAKELSAYSVLDGHLLQQGFAQHGEPLALGLSPGGTLAMMSLVTEFTASSADTPRAVLMYGLTDSGGSAAVLLLDAENVITSVLTVGPRSTIVSTPVRPPPNVPATAAATNGANATSPIALSVANCQQTCGFYIESILLALEVGATLAIGALMGGAAPLGLALMVAGWGLSQSSYFSPVAGQAATALALVGPLLGEDASLVNYALQMAKFADKKMSKEFLKTAACSEVCKTKLRACCNYTGVCFNSDAVCEKNCPGGLAHPMAHCDVYINGKKVSTLIPG